jgi:hypothetical protein
VDRFGLTIHPTKTKLTEFGRPTRDQSSGKGKGHTFDFLGFTHYWARSKPGNWVIKRKTKRAKMHAAMTAIWNWCKWNRHMPIKAQWLTLCQKLRGHYQYFGIRGNYKPMEVYFEYVEMAWKRWLGRRHRNGFIAWQTFESHHSVIFPLPTPRIVHNV